MAIFNYSKNYEEVFNGIGSESFVIFGQSAQAMVFYLASKLEGKEDNFKSFILSSKKRCKYKVSSMVGHPVEDIEWLKCHPEIKYCFIAARRTVINNELKKLFEDFDITFYYIDEETYTVEKQYYESMMLNNLHRNYYVYTDWDYVGNKRLSEKDGGAYYMYAPKVYLGVWPSENWFKTPNLNAIHDKQFGRYERLGESNNDNFTSKCKIYMAKTVFDRSVVDDVKSENTVVIQGGADLTFDRFGKYQDNVGENISARNRDYCEMTNVYWAWKNDMESDYIGLCHYRRRFMLNKKMINYMVENNYDVITTTPYLENNTVYDEFCTQNWFLDKEEWNSITESIKNVAPDYMDSWNELKDSSMFLPCNMIIMRRDIFNEYCEFLFSVTEDVDKYFMEKIGQKNNRYLGYIAELLTNVYIMKHRDTLKKAYVDMKILHVQ